MDQHSSRQRNDSRPPRSAEGRGTAGGQRRDTSHTRGEDRAGRDAPRAKGDRREGSLTRRSGGGAASAQGRGNTSASNKISRTAANTPQRRSDAEAGNTRSPQRQSAAPAAAKERYPQAEFARREGMLDGMPAVMLVNRSLKGYAFRKEFPWCLRLVVAYRADTTSGLPLPKEERVLEAFEQNLFGLLKKSVNGHYVGHTTWRGSREFVFYVDEGSEAEDPLNAFAESQKRELEFALEDDPQWTHAAHYFDYTD